MIESNSKLLEKLIDIQQRLKVPKDDFNSFGKYNYRNVETIEDKVKPFLREHNLVLILSDEVIEVGGRIYVKATAHLTDGTDKIEAFAYAREAEVKKGMDEAQITGSCSSYARKYALGGLFLIDDTKDADSGDNSKKAATASPKTAWVPSDKIPMTDDQKMTIANLLRQRGIEGEEMVTWIWDNYGADPKKLTEAQAVQIASDLDYDRKVKNGQIKEPVT